MLNRAKNVLDILNHMAITREAIVHERGQLSCVLDAVIINYQKRPSYEKFCHLKYTVEWAEKFLEEYAKSLGGHNVVEVKGQATGS